MSNEEKAQLVAAMIPLEVLCGQIRVKPYKEMTVDFQRELLDSLDILHKLAFGQTVNS